MREKAAESGHRSNTLRREVNEAVHSTAGGNAAVSHRLVPGSVSWMKQAWGFRPLCVIALCSRTADSRRSEHESSSAPGSCGPGARPLPRRAAYVSVESVPEEAIPACPAIVRRRLGPSVPQVRSGMSCGVVQVLLHLAARSKTPCEVSAGTVEKSSPVPLRCLMRVSGVCGGSCVCVRIHN